MSRPLVSVITAQTGTLDQLQRAHESVLKQDYKGPIEHVVVRDGHWMDDLKFEDVENRSTRYCQLGRSWDKFTNDEAAGTTATLVGTYLARGEVICHLDAQAFYRPNHVSRLTAALDRVNFAYSRAQLQNEEGDSSVVGREVPAWGDLDISTLCYRPRLLLLANWRCAGNSPEWDLVSRWMAHRAIWRHVPEITVDYHQ